MLLLISPVESLLTLGEDGIGIVNRSIVDAIEILKRGLVSIWSGLAGVTSLGFDLSEFITRDKDFVSWVVLNLIGRISHDLRENIVIDVQLVVEGH